MNDKERLESIKEDVEIGIKVWGISIDAIKWLIEQAEKKTELEQSYRRTISKQNKQITALYKENKRYREAMVTAISEAECIMYQGKSKDVDVEYARNIKRDLTDALEESE